MLKKKINLQKNLCVIVLMFLIVACATPGIKKNEEKGYNPIFEPSQTINETKNIFLTGDAIKALVELSEKQLEKLKRFLNKSGFIQHMGVWNIQVSASSTKREDVRQTAETSQKAEATVTPIPWKEGGTNEKSNT